MDFGTLLHVAKKNNENLKKDGKYYSTKFAPPKKENKEKKLSDNIQKFLQKKEQEEREKQNEEKRKLTNLLAMRDEKSKNKIRKMLKVTKSANKSVLDEAINMEHTALSMQGADHLDQDDYGYVSNEANAFYQKYIEKVKDVKEDKGFQPSRPQSLKDLTGTKARVKAAITKEIEDQRNPATRIRTTTTSTSKEPSSGSGVARAYTTSKSLYDPEAERRDDERKKRDEEQKKAKNRKPPPPIMDFQALLRLAEKKQHEPVAGVAEVKKKKEPERLLTSKEKREYEERQRLKEARERRDRERDMKERDIAKKDSTSKGGGRMEANGRIPKLNQPSKAQPGASSSGPTSTTANNKTPIKSLTKPNVPPSKSPSIKPTSSSSSSSKLSSTAVNTKKTTSALPSKAVAASTSNASTASKNPYAGTSKNPATTREFPPRDIKSIKPRQFPPPDVRRSGPCGRADERKPKPNQSKRRILDDDDDEDEYDSELDDFIDDGDCGEDYSSHIKAIFGYDKSKYRHLDDDDDRAMESNFAQVQREEFLSKKIGIQEDLEDMKQEAIDKKRKMMMKKRRLND